MNLRDIIENYKPFNEQEQKDKETFIKWIDTFDDVLTRNNVFAHFTSSAFVLNKERTKMLMIYHNIYDSWGWTGGHADGEQDLLGVALREVQEETGVKNLKPLINDIFVLDTLGVQGHFKRGKYVSAHVHLSVAYLVEADENEPIKIKEDENSGVAWIPIEEVVAKSTEPHMRTIYQKAIDKIKTFNF
jgi:ADP-ribose pyrophosphatase YjhB (NUDIX family)